MRSFPFYVAIAIAQPQIDEEAVARAYQSLAQHLLPTIFAYNNLQADASSGSANVPPSLLSKAIADAAAAASSAASESSDPAKLTSSHGAGASALKKASSGSQFLEGAQATSSGMEAYPIIQSLGEAVRNAAEIPAMVLNEALLTQATNAMHGATARGANSLRGSGYTGARAGMLLADINGQSTDVTVEVPSSTAVVAPQISNYLPMQPMFQSQTDYIDALTAAGVPRFVPMVVSSLLAPLGLLKMEASTQVQDLTKSIAEGATLQPAIQTLNNAFIQPALNQLPPTPFTSALDNAVSFAMNRLSDGAQQAVFPIQAAALAANALASAIGDFSAAAVPFPVPTSGSAQLPPLTP